MDVRVGLVVLLVSAALWGCDARYLVSPDLSGVENAGVNADVCALCEEYTTMVLDYLNDNKTQARIVEFLHQYCLQKHGLNEECIILVDRFAPLFFFEVSLVQPQGFCKAVGLCNNARMSSFLSGTQTKCDLCHKAVNKVVVKLEDPDTKLEIIVLLLKACTAAENYMKKCKNMVFEFGPLILDDAEKFIKEADLCTKFHACTPAEAETEKVLEGKIEVVTSSS